MVGDFFSGLMVMAFGYAYPAFECFKVVGKNKVSIDELRFWCQYWIIMALLIVFGTTFEVFISWLPLYGEMKLAFIIFLWHPNTKGSINVYEKLVNPIISRHEKEIDMYLQLIKLRTKKFVMHYWQNCAQLGQGAFFQVLQYLLMQSQKLKTSNFGEAAPATNTDKEH